MMRAFVLNIKNGKRVSGGSTISMQVIRLARKKKQRTYGEKLKEMILALRLECSYSKGEILALYAANAPYGGNIVGLEAASRFYFRRKRLPAKKSEKYYEKVPSKKSLQASLSGSTCISYQQYFGWRVTPKASVMFSEPLLTTFCSSITKTLTCSRFQKVSLLSNNFFLSCFFILTSCLKFKYCKKFYLRVSLKGTYKRLFSISLVHHRLSSI